MLKIREGSDVLVRGARRAEGGVLVNAFLNKRETTSPFETCSRLDISLTAASTSSSILRVVRIRMLLNNYTCPAVIASNSDAQATFCILGKTLQGLPLLFCKKYNQVFLTNVKPNLHFGWGTKSCGAISGIELFANMIEV